MSLSCLDVVHRYYLVTWLDGGSGGVVTKHLTQSHDGGSLQLWRPPSLVQYSLWDRSTLLTVYEMFARYNRPLCHRTAEQTPGWLSVATSRFLIYFDVSAELHLPCTSLDAR